MRYLPMPEDAGDTFIKKQCKLPGWAEREEAWLDATAAYRLVQGNPWQIAPADFTVEVRNQFYKLYDSRRKGGPIERIRRPKGGFPSCPMCGSGGGRSLDHALPRADFPEFSILRENLIPACTICNSDEKGTLYRGDASPERFIHPYYDTWAGDALWSVGFEGDLDAVLFKPMVMDSVPAAYRQVVHFHLSQVLGVEWRENARRYWGSLPQLIRNRIGAQIPFDLARKELQSRLGEEILQSGVNCWRAAFLRGALESPAVIAHLASRAEVLPG